MEKIKEIIRHGDYVVSEEPVSLEESLETRKKVLKYGAKRLFKNGKLIYPRSTYIRLKNRKAIKPYYYPMIPFPDLHYTRKYSEPKWIQNLQQKTLFDIPSLEEKDIQFGEVGLQPATTKKTLWGTLINIMSMATKPIEKTVSLVSPSVTSYYQERIKTAETKIAQAQAAQSQAEAIETIKTYLPVVIGGAGMLILAYFYYKRS